MTSLLVLAATIAAVALGSVSEQSATNPASLDSLDGTTIAVDPGHNGGNAKHSGYINRLVPAGGFRKACDTVGAATSDERLTESQFNWDVSQRLVRLLRESGATVVLTRSSNNGFGPCIDRRARIGNKAKADAAISIHADGGPPTGRGFHVIRPGLVRGYTEPIVAPSRELALSVRAALDSIGLKRANYIAKDGWIARRDLGGLNLSKVPKVLVELGNMRNARDGRLIKSRKWRERVARALRTALAGYLVEEKTVQK